MAKSTQKKVATGSMTITPLGDRVLIKELRADTKTTGGIILPESMVQSDMDMKQGTVVAVGPGRVSDEKVIPVAVKKGDRVLFKKWADKINLEGQEYYIAGEHDLVATISN